MSEPREVTTQELLMLIGDKEATIFGLRRWINELISEIETLKATPTAAPIVDHGEQ